MIVYYARDLENRSCAMASVNLQRLRHSQTKHGSKLRFTDGAQFVVARNRVWAGAKNRLAPNS
jgi:hypothetical protein